MHITTVCVLFSDRRIIFNGEVTAAADLEKKRNRSLGFLTTGTKWEMLCRLPWYHGLAEVILQAQTGARATVDMQRSTAQAHCHGISLTPQQAMVSCSGSLHLTF